MEYCMRSQLRVSAFTQPESYFLGLEARRAIHRWLERGFARRKVVKTDGCVLAGDSR